MVKKRRSASAAVKKTYLALVLAFLYVPIVVMIALSFNASVSRAEWTGFTLNWYKKLLQREDIIAALEVTLEVAALATIASTIIGTLGAARESAHAQKVCENVENLVRAQNTLAGHFLCRGSIDLARTARRLRIPEGEKGHLSPERFEKQKESLGHPNAEELAQCQMKVKEFLKAL